MPGDLNGESRTLLPVKSTVVVKLVVNILVNILANILVNMEAVHLPLPPRPFVPTQPQNSVSRNHGPEAGHAAVGANDNATSAGLNPLGYCVLSHSPHVRLVQFRAVRVRQRFPRMANCKTETGQMFMHFLGLHSL